LRQFSRFRERVATISIDDVHYIRAHLEADPVD
jgi:hypothetical protein